MPIFDDVILNDTNFKDNISPYSHVNRKCKTESKLRESGISVATKNDGPYLWRKLPGNVRTQCDLNSFKRQVKKMDLESFLLEKCPTGCFLCYS